MRSCCLAAGMWLTLMLAGDVGAQTTQVGPIDHEHPLVGLPGARQLAVKPFTRLPSGVLFLRIENFPTTQAAQDAATPVSAVVQWVGKVWLLTLGPKGERSSGATLIAEIGPVPEVPPAGSYVLDVNE